MSRTLKSGVMGGLLGFHHERPVQPWLRIAPADDCFPNL